MLTLDREKFSLAKNINELESGSHALETTLARLKEELENVGAEEDVNNKENENTDDATMYLLSLRIDRSLRLKVYRGLGIDIVEDGSGGYGKAVVRMAF
jgi:kinetochore protein Spc24